MTIFLFLICLLPEYLHFAPCRKPISPLHYMASLLRNDQSLFEKVTGLLKER
jgi:hypothetical protein